MTTPSPPLVLVVDDEPRIRKLVAIALADEGIVVLEASSAREALAIARDRRPDLVLLDVVLPDLDGLAVMGLLREERPVPVILLSAHGSAADRVRGLELGADDFVAKPFRPADLARRVRAVLRRVAEPTAVADGVLWAGDVEIDLVRHIVRRHGEVVALGRTEWRLLETLAARPGRAVHARDVLIGVWGPDYGEDEDYLRVWIGRLRRRLSPTATGPGAIREDECGGYRLEAHRRPG